MSTGYPDTRANWRERAACRSADPELFFPIGTAGLALGQIDEAKRICRRCLVQARCLAWALDHRVTDGIWGGTTEDERRTARHLPGEAASTRRASIARITSTR